MRPAGVVERFGRGHTDPIEPGGHAQLPKIVDVGGPEHGAHRRTPAMDPRCGSADATSVSQPRRQPRFAEQAQRPHLGHIDDRPLRRAWREQMKVTTQSAHTSVCCIAHSSQSIRSGSAMLEPYGGGVTVLSPPLQAPERRSPPGRSGGGFLGGDPLDVGGRFAPAAHHGFDCLGQHLLVLDLEVAAHGVVVKRLRAARRRHVEPREIAARRAPVARSPNHRSDGTGVAPRSLRSNTCSSTSGRWLHLPSPVAGAPRGNARSTTSAPRCTTSPSVVVDLETTGGSPGRLRHHRGRGGEAPRRRVPRHLPDAGQPRSGHPTADHRAHRHHPGHGATRRPRSTRCCRPCSSSSGTRWSSATTCASTSASSRPPCDRTGRPRLDNRSIDTYGLARRLVRDEVPNCKLGTLASPPPPAATRPRTAPSTTRSPPATCCTCCSSGRPVSGLPASTICSRCPRWAATRRPASSSSPPSSPGRPACTCSATDAGRCCTSARPPTCGRGCGRTSRATSAARSAQLLRETQHDRPHRVPHPARSRGARGAAHPRAHTRASTGACVIGRSTCT